MDKRVPVHVHSSLISALLTFLEFLLAWIPLKIIAAKYEDRSPLAAAILRVL